MAQVQGENLVPKKVKEQYALKFPDATTKKWQKKGRDFVATMTHENKDAWVRYTKDGKMRWVCHTWKGPDVPVRLMTKILGDFPGFKASWATETENPNLNKHQFLIRLTKPGFVLKVLINADGTYAKEDIKELKNDRK